MIKSQALIWGKSPVYLALGQFRICWQRSEVNFYDRLMVAVRHVRGGVWVRILVYTRFVCQLYWQGPEDTFSHLVPGLVGGRANMQAQEVLSELLTRVMNALGCPGRDLVRRIDRDLGQGFLQAFQ